MEEYSHLGENSGPRGSSFLYGGGPVLAPTSSSVYGRTSSGSNNLPINNNTFHLQSANDQCYDRQSAEAAAAAQQTHHHHPIVKTETGGGGGSSSTSQHGHKFHYPSLISRGHHPTVQDHHHHHHHHHHQQENENSGEVEAIKAKIIAHPQYSNLLEAYMDCQKVLLFFPLNAEAKAKASDLTFNLK